MPKKGKKSYKIVYKDEKGKKTKVVIKASDEEEALAIFFGDNDVSPNNIISINEDIIKESPTNVAPGSPESGVDGAENSEKSVMKPMVRRKKKTLKEFCSDTNLDEVVANKDIEALKKAKKKSRKKCPSGTTPSFDGTKYICTKKDKKKSIETKKLMRRLKKTRSFKKGRKKAVATKKWREKQNAYA